MANVSSINGNPIVVGTSGIADGAVTDAKLLQIGGVLTRANDTKDNVEDGYFICQEFANGGFEEGRGIRPSTQRLYCTKEISVNSADRVLVNSGDNTQVALNVVDSAKLHTLQASGWIADEAEFVVNQDGYLIVLARLSDNSEISPSDYDSSVEVYNSYAYRLSLEMGRIGSLEGETLRNMYIKGDSTIGTTQNGLLAVYQVEPFGIYDISKKITSSSFRVAFGSASADELEDGIEVSGYESFSGTSCSVINLWNLPYLYVFYAVSTTYVSADDALRVEKSTTPQYVINVGALDANDLAGNFSICVSGNSVGDNFPIQETCWVNCIETENGICLQEVVYTTSGKKFFRQRTAQLVWLDWHEVQMNKNASEKGVTAIYFSPVIARRSFESRYRGRSVFWPDNQDFAVYNGDVFDFAVGKCSINNGQAIDIANGHGNNAMFGKTLHGDYPYLYCGSWNLNESNVYVNQYANGAFTLVNTIHFSDITGYLNSCVDEENMLVYMLVAKTSPVLGDIDFVIGDFSGNVVSRKTVDAIPYIEGMTFYDGAIIVTSGHSGEPSLIHIFDIEGNLLSKTASVESSAPLEAIDVDNATGKMYVGTTDAVYYDADI